MTTNGHSYTSATFQCTLAVREFVEVQPRFDGPVGLTGLSLVCPLCGEMWAHMTLHYVQHLVNHEVRRAPFRSFDRPCEKCVLDGGSILDNNYVHAISPHLNIGPRLGPQATYRELLLATRIIQHELHSRTSNPTGATAVHSYRVNPGGTTLG